MSKDDKLMNGEIANFHYYPLVNLIVIPLIFLFGILLCFFSDFHLAALIPGVPMIALSPIMFVMVISATCRPILRVQKDGIQIWLIAHHRYLDIPWEKCSGYEFVTVEYESDGSNHPNTLLSLICKPHEFRENLKKIYRVNTFFFGDAYKSDAIVLPETKEGSRVLVEALNRYISHLGTAEEFEMGLRKMLF